MILVTIWWRAFSIVSMTALNVVMISQHRFLMAFLTGTLLSYIWWMNTKTAVKAEGRIPQVTYALGAGCGTITGMILGGLFRG